MHDNQEIEADCEEEEILWTSKEFVLWILSYIKVENISLLTIKRTRAQLVKALASFLFSKDWGRK